MGKLRTNGTDDFPVESRSGGINYILIHPDAEYQHFKSTKGQMENLLSTLEQIHEEDRWTLLGVWKGSYRSDTFDLDINQFREKMNDADL